MGICAPRPRKVDVRLHGKGNSNSHGARPVNLIITMIKWIRTNRLSMNNSLLRTTTRHAFQSKMLNPCVQGFASRVEG